MSGRVRIEVEKGVYREETPQGDMVTVYDLHRMSDDQKRRYGFIVKPDRGEPIIACETDD